MKEINGKHWLILLTLFVACAYFGVLFNDFIRYDDIQYVVDNPHIKGGVSIKTIKWAFTNIYFSNWHPLTWISHAIDYDLFGLNPTGHHLVSALFHLCNSMLIFFFLSKATTKEMESGLVALIFAIHPIHVESVAWVAERKDVLCAFFWWLALLSYVNYVRNPSAVRYACVCVVFVLSLLSKPMAVTFPFVLLLLDWWPLGRMRRHEGVNQRTYASLIWEKFPLLVFSVASSIVTFVAQKQGGALGPYGDDSMAYNVGNAFISYISYISRIICPNKLAALYPFDGTTVTVSKVATSFAILALLTALAIKLRKGRPYILFGWLWFLGTLIPVIGIIRVGSHSIADRYMYVPALGLYLTFVWLAFDLTKSYRHSKRLRFIASCFILAALSIVTMTQVTRWRNTVTLFTHTIMVTNDNWMAHNVLGVAYKKEGNLGKALEHYKEGLKIHPQDPVLWNNFGNALRLLDKKEAAIAAFHEAIHLKPAYPDAISNLALTYAEIGDAPSASHQLNELKRLDPHKASELQAVIASINAK